MLLNAQRIRSPEHPLQLYLYLHERSWDGGAPPVMALPEAKLVLQRGAQQLGNQKLNSYLTVLAPDEVEPSELTAVYSRLWNAELASTALPWTAGVGRCVGTFGIDAQLAAAWRAELQLLFFSAAGLLTEWRSTPRAS